jgi:hypothetical protein
MEQWFAFRALNSQTLYGFGTDQVESALRPAFQRYRRLGTISTGARSIACATLGMARVASANAPQCP